MKKIFPIAIFSLIVFLCLGFAVRPVYAQGGEGPGGIKTSGLTNPSIPKELGGNAVEANSGTTFSRYFVMIWQSLIVIGALAMLFNLIHGAIQWIMAGGDKQKVEHARNKITEGIVGLFILASSFALIAFVGQLLHFDVLKITLPSPNP